MAVAAAAPVEHIDIARVFEDAAQQRTLIELRMWHPIRTSILPRAHQGERTHGHRYTCP
jgi:hypothetical protein